MLTLPVLRTDREQTTGAERDSVISDQFPKEITNKTKKINEKNSTKSIFISICRLTRRATQGTIASALTVSPP